MKTIRIITFIIGLILLSFCFKFYSAQANFVSYAIKTSGTVYDYSYSSSSSSSSSKRSQTMHAPKILFITNQGKTIKFTSDVSSGSPDYEIGGKVPLLYSSDNPRNVYIKY